MITFSEGNMFDAHVEAMVNTVNLVGVMGKGVALQFKERFKENYELYRKACNNRSIGIGRSLVVPAIWQGNEIYIVNFPTKVHWRSSSEYTYVEQGLDNLRNIIESYNIRSIAIPPLGAGNGGLDWDVVKQMIVEKLQNLNCNIIVYEPGHKAVSQERKVRMTQARALLLCMLDRLQREGCDATEFSAVKLIYFMQKFGAEPIFKLSFVKYLYGPYSEKVKHILHNIDGAYITGFADKSKKPFEPFDIIRENLYLAKQVVESDFVLKDIISKTENFLEDNWDNYSLELLSSVDFLISNNPTAVIDDIYNELCGWSHRKAKLFADKKLTESAYKLISNATQTIL